MNPALVGRLAPSPTGVLHLGNARSFLLAWLSIRSRGGRILLRIEDLDGPRIRAGAEDATLEDLCWMGLDWDGTPLRQSERGKLYEAAEQRLLEQAQAYPCVCTRSEIAEAASAPHEGEVGVPPYSGHCRGRFSSREDAREQSGREAALRFRVDGVARPFHDGFYGEQEGRLDGDFVISKRDGEAAYQLAVVIDDAASGVTEVLRADDLLPSTPRQLLLFEALGLRSPAFIHTPLLVGPDGRRLAKRHGDTSLRYFRERGVAPERLVGYLAEISGLASAGARLRPQDLVEDFRIDCVARKAVVVPANALVDEL